jgi:hypothetical protein
MHCFNSPSSAFASKDTMTYIIGQHFPGDIVQLVGSLEADSPEQARRLAEARWPKLALSVNELDSSAYRNGVATGESGAE